MAKGYVRKKGKKWYARFYVEDESGRKVQKEFVGTESKSETEALLRKASLTMRKRNSLRSLKTSQLVCCSICGWRKN